MELLEGGDLRTFLGTREEPLADSHARRVIGDVCAGVVFFHSKVIIHGDLKSANVLFDTDGRARVSHYVHLLGGTGLMYVITLSRT